MTADPEPFASPAHPTTRRALLRALLLAGLIPPAARAGLLGPKGGDAAEKKANVLRQRDEMLQELFAAKPELRDQIKQAVGFGTFKQTDVNLLLMATGNGYGQVTDNRSGKTTFMRMASLGGGVGAGVRDIRVIFIFKDPQVLQQFLEQGWQFGGKADTAAMYKGTGAAAEGAAKANVDVKQGTVAAASAADARSGSEKTGSDAAGVAAGGAMEIYQFTESGLSLQATVSGTKYWKDSELNP